ncbi:hypothetical protein BFP97_16485 [Roseivirga sp. 4D4]|nr:hypothetical protein BFP97_16485 [Roseivirga sp. 4D4]
MYKIGMSTIPKEKLGKVIDALIDSSVELHHVEIKIKGLQNSIDELSTKLFFHYTDSGEGDE